MPIALNSKSHGNQEYALFLTAAQTTPGDVTDKIFNKYAIASSASTRLQVLPAFKASSRLGLTPRAYSLQSTCPEKLELIGYPKVCFVGKLIASASQQASFTMANLATLSRMKTRNIPIISSYTDNWCDATNWADKPEKLINQQDLYRDIMAMTNLAVFPSEVMRSSGGQWLSKEAVSKVILDPCYLSSKSFPFLDINGICRLIWFGHGSNSDFLLRHLPQIIEKCRAAKFFELTVLTDKSTCDRIHYFFKRFNQNGNWKLRMVDWFDTVTNPNLFEQELVRAHIALLPSDPNSSRKSTCSHNRAVDALQAGCMVIASPIESYKELSKVLLITDDFARTVDQGIFQYERLVKKWSGLREIELSPFSPARNIESWEQVFLEAIKMST